MSDWQEIKDKCHNLYRNGIYFDCPKGWFKIVLDLSLKLEEILYDHPQLDKMYACQVKEKYGTLRFYMNMQMAEMTKLIDEAEALSVKTCEGCGEPGTFRIKCFCCVSCDKCFKEMFP